MDIQFARMLDEPCHDKTCLCHMQTKKTQISLRICSWAGRIESYLVANSRRQVLLWCGSYGFRQRAEDLAPLATHCGQGTTNDKMLRSLVTWHGSNVFSQKCNIFVWYYFFTESSKLCLSSQLKWFKYVYGERKKLSLDVRWLANESRHEKICFLPYTNSLISIFVIHCLDSIIPPFSISEISSL